MGFIFDFLGSMFGYLIWFLFDAVSNYALAITLFTLIVNAILFPTVINRQRSMSKNAYMSAKQAELKKKYEKNPKKYNEEWVKLYEREGFSPLSGCLPMLIPIILLSGIIGAINKPLQNTLHIPQEKIVQAVEVLPTVPELEGKVSKGYEELQVIKYFPEIKDKLTMMNEDELADIEEYSSGFNFCGIDLLKKPNECKFSEMLWVIPVLCFVGSVASAIIMKKSNPQTDQMPGCGKYLPYLSFLVIAWISYTVPGAIGFYWVVSSAIGVIQSLIINKYYNKYTINAKDEAARCALLELQEAKVKKIK